MRHRTRRGWVLGALLLVVVLLVASCADDDDTSATTSTPDTTDASSGIVDAEDTDDELDLSEVNLRVGVTAGASSHRRAIIEASAVLDDVPYGVELIEFESARAAVEAMTAGAIDVAVNTQGTIGVLALGNSSPTWTAETAPIVIVGAESPLADVGFSLLVPVDSPVESVVDLAGGRVAYSPGAFGHYFLIRLMRDSGMDATAIEQIQLPPSEGRAAFIGGSVDGIVSGYRAMLSLVDGGHARIVASSSDIGVEHRVTYARRQVLDDPLIAAAIGDLLMRLDEMNEWAADNTEEVTQIFETVGAMSADDARHAAETVAEQRVRIDSVIADFQDQADVFHAEGVMDHQVDVRILFDDRFDSTVPSR